MPGKQQQSLSLSLLVTCKWRGGWALRFNLGSGWRKPRGPALARVQPRGRGCGSRSVSECGGGRRDSHIREARTREREGGGAQPNKDDCLQLADITQGVRRRRPGNGKGTRARRAAGAVCPDPDPTSDRNAGRRRRRRWPPGSLGRWVAVIVGARWQSEEAWEWVGWGGGPLLCSTHSPLPSHV